MTADQDQGEKMRPLCGRAWYGGPLLPRWVHPEGAPWKKRIWVPGRLYDRLTGYVSVWVCRQDRDHYAITLRPAKKVWRKATELIAPPTPKTNRERRLARLGKWPAWTTKETYARVETRSRELFHQYTFSRRERVR